MMATSSANGWTAKRLRQVAKGAERRPRPSGRVLLLVSTILLGLAGLGVLLTPGAAGLSAPAPSASPTASRTPTPSPTSTPTPTPTATALALATLSVEQAGVLVGAIGSVTETPSPTLVITPVETATSTQLAPTATPFTAALATPYAKTPTYVVRGGQIVYRANPDPEIGCTLQAIRGTVTGADGRPRWWYGLALIIEDESGRSARYALAGSRPQYGPSGFEFVLARQPEASVGRYYLILQDEDGMVVSDKYAIPTYSDCDQAIIEVNFIEKEIPVP